MDYLKLFQNHSEYEDFVSGGMMVKPNVSHCVNENEVHYNPIPDPFNGHEYVDLGLPSGTKWATMNVGAESEVDFGLYFAWGETQGYTATQVGTDKQFDWTDYRYGDSPQTLTKYNDTDNKRRLDAEDDAVKAAWGGDWRMPTAAEIQELIDNTTSVWTNDYQGSGVSGRIFSANGNTLFIPAAGLMYEGQNDYEGACNFWASDVIIPDVYGAFYITATKNWVSLNNSEDIGWLRCCGISMRGVVKP